MSAAGRRTPQVTVPAEVVDRIHRLCLRLPEATVAVDESRTVTRSTAWSFAIRRRSFCLLVAAKTSARDPVTILILRSDPGEREALLSIGHPYFIPRAGPGRIGVMLTGDTDWEEIGELTIESYRVLAPKKLVALLP